MLLLAGCSASDGRLTIKSSSVPVSAVARPVPARVAEARGQLALGNVALALEGFRTAERNDPSSTDAIVGIAACYDRMGRFELSRRYYEKALALAPTDPDVLAAFATSLELKGAPAEAAEVRLELVLRTSAARQSPAAPAPSAGSVTVSLPGPIAVAVAQPPRAVLAPTPRAASVTVTLPRPSTVVVAQPLKAAAAPPPRAVTKRVAERRGPRLERLSLAEVALVTVQPRRWESKVISRTASSVTLRFVPLRSASGQSRVRLLNSARYQGLAARTRSTLRRMGWTQVTIGDSPRVRQKSLVLYSPATEHSARRLARQLGFGLARDPRPGPLTVLLGRDAIRAS